MYIVSDHNETMNGKKSRTAMISSWKLLQRNNDLKVVIEYSLVLFFLNLDCDF